MMVLHSLDALLPEDSLTLSFAGLDASLVLRLVTRKCGLLR